MLARRNRITEKKDFDNVFQRGRIFKSGFLILRYSPNYLPESRFGFIISTKVSKKSTLRNRLKRKMREAARAILKSSAFSKSFDIVISLTPEAAKANFKDIQKTFELILKQNNIIN
ncbi:MAG: ribonuclease P protein component [Parcubacteria group bacterium]|nr:ribonuclease P protein component [Parcubacteria group bacterium]